MAAAHLGRRLISTLAGIDLQFPHHENEIADKVAAQHGSGTFARVWMHNGMLNF